MHRRGLGRVQERCRLLQQDHQRLDERFGFRPLVVRPFAPGQGLLDKHLSGGEGLRHDRQAVQVRGNPGGHAQQLRLAVIHNLRQKRPLHPGKDHHTLVRQVVDGQTNCVPVTPEMFAQDLGVGPHPLDELIRIRLQRIVPLLPGVRADLRPHHEAVGMNALRRADDTGGREVGRQHRAQNRQRRRRLLHTGHVSPQGGALLFGRFESGAHVGVGSIQIDWF